MRAPSLPHRLALLLLVATVGCGGDRRPEGQEEIPKSTADVPTAVQLTAARIGGMLGVARVQDWYWDTESNDWEVGVIGLTRQAELDVGTDGAFHELELVYSLAEVEATLPEVADFIRRECRDDPAVFIELSLRREVLLDPVPELADAWKLSGVVLEFQCSNGRDFEIDARMRVLENHVDDVGVQSHGDIVDR